MAVERDLKAIEYVAKPATTLLLTGAAVAGSANAWVVVALLLCLAGDVFLMLPSDQFVAGLASFLLGHLFFIAAFFADMSDDRPLVGVTAGLAVAAVAVSLGPVLRGAVAEDARLRIPVLAYVAVITAMLVASGVTNDGLAVAGAAVFVLSDSVLARNRFVRPIARGRLAVMVTYHAALALLVVSLA